MFRGKGLRVFDIRFRVLWLLKGLRGSGFRALTLGFRVQGVEAFKGLRGLRVQNFQALRGSGFRV